VSNHPLLKRWILQTTQDLGKISYLERTLQYVGKYLFRTISAHNLFVVHFFCFVSWRCRLCFLATTRRVLTKGFSSFQPPPHARSETSPLNNMWPVFSHPFRLFLHNHPLIRPYITFRMREYSLNKLRTDSFLNSLSKSSSLTFYRAWPLQLTQHHFKNQEYANTYKLEDRHYSLTVWRPH
jgi:hypothetical protein